MLCSSSKTYCWYDVTTNRNKFSNKGLTKRAIEQSADWPWETYRRVRDENTNITTTNRGFRTNNHAVATYKKTRKDFLIFTQKEL